MGFASVLTYKGIQEDAQVCCRLFCAPPINEFAETFMSVLHRRSPSLYFWLTIQRFGNGVSGLEGFTKALRAGEPRRTSLNTCQLLPMFRVLEETTRPGRSSRSQCHCQRNLDPRSRSEDRGATPPLQPANRQDREAGLERERSLGNPRTGFCLPAQR